MIILKSVSIVFANNCFYIKKVEYKNDKIINATTEYNCKTIKKNDDVNLNTYLPTETIYISEPSVNGNEPLQISNSINSNNNYNNKVYLSYNSVKYIEYIDMVYFNDNYNQIFEYQPKSLLGKVFYTLARIILLQ